MFQMNKPFGIFSLIMIPILQRYLTILMILDIYSTFLTTLVSP